MEYLKAMLTNRWWQLFGISRHDDALSSTREGYKDCWLCGLSRLVYDHHPDVHEKGQPLSSNLGLPSIPFC